MTNSPYITYGKPTTNWSPEVVNRIISAVATPAETANKSIGKKKAKNAKPSKVSPRKTTDWTDEIVVKAVKTVMLDTRLTTWLAVVESLKMVSGFFEGKSPKSTIANVKAQLKKCVGKLAYPKRKWETTTTTKQSIDDVYSMFVTNDVERTNFINEWNRAMFVEFDGELAIKMVARNTGKTIKAVRESKKAIEKVLGCKLIGAAKAKKHQTVKNASKAGEFHATKVA